MEENVHLIVMNQTLTNMQQRNTKTGYLMMAKSAIFSFKSMPEVAAVLQTLAEIYDQPEQSSVDNLRQQLLALRAARPNTMYVELAQPAEVIYVGRGVNPSFTPTKAPTPDLIRMIDFALAELEKGWPQQNAGNNNNAHRVNPPAREVQLPPNFGLSPFDIQMARFAPFAATALVLAGFVPRDIPHRNMAIALLLLAGIAGMAYSIHRFWQPARNNNPPQAPQNNPQNPPRPQGGKK